VPPHTFSVDGERLLYGRFVRADGGFDFQEFHEVTLEPDSFQPGPLGGLVRDLDLLRERIETLLESITSPVSDASLVLPDSWLRLAFADLEERPRRLADAEDILRWKLKKQVPFRVEELRLRGVSAPATHSSGGGRRVLLGYAMDQLLRQLEQAFAARGVRIGLMVNTSLALCQALARLSTGDDRVGFVLTSKAGYSLAFTRGGSLTFHRFRAIGDLETGNGNDALIGRDLRLTREFLNRETSEHPTEEFLIVAHQTLARMGGRSVRGRGGGPSAAAPTAQGRGAAAAPARYLAAAGRRLPSGLS
jgi:type IV pilus assembly protein PilM